MICDTSGLLAGFDPDDEHHDAVTSVVRARRGPLVVSPYVVAELDHLLRRRHSAGQARAVIRSLGSGAFDLPDFPAADLALAVELDGRYAALDLGVVDASLVVLARRYETRDLLTLDERDFRAVTPLQGGAFRLLPADA